MVEKLDKLGSIRYDELQNFIHESNKFMVDSDPNKGILPKNEEYFKSSCQPHSLDQAAANEIIKEKTSSKKGILSYFLDFFGWGAKAPEAAKTQESPDQATKPVGAHPKLAQPIETYLDQARKMNLERIKGIEEEFSTQDPKKGDALIMAVLIALINQNRENRETDGILAADQVNEMQESIAEAQKRKKEVVAEMEKLAKSNNFHIFIDKIAKGGSMAGFAITGVLAITGAATIASGGTLAPLLAAASIFSGVSTGLGAINGFVKNKNDITIEKNKGISLEINEKKNIIQFEIRVTMDQLKQAMKDVSTNIEELTKVLEMMQESQAIFR